MATSKKYLSLEEAASLLKIKTEELIRFREKGEIRGFADRGTWKFKSGDVEEFARRRQADSDPDVGVIEDDYAPSSSKAASAMDDEDDELGRQATVIRKDRPTDSDSDVRLFDEPPKKGKSAFAGEDSEIRLTEGKGSRFQGSESAIRTGGADESEIRFEDDDLPPVDSVIQLASSEVLFADSEIEFSPSEIQLFGRKESDSDSDVKLVNLLAPPPVSDSDSDVKLVSDKKSSGDKKSKLNDSDSDVKLAKSDSDVNLVRLKDSDSDVQLVDHSKKKKIDDSDSDVKLTLTESDSDVKLINQRSSIGDATSDSDVAILPPTKRDYGKTDELEGASLFDDEDPGITLPGDSGIQLAGDSGIRLSGGSGLRLTGDSGIRLAGESPVRLSEDSGIQLQQPADSGILLEGDSGLTLDNRGDSGLRLSGESSMKLRSGSSKNLAKGSSSKNLKGRSKKQDDLDQTAPMLSTVNDDEDDLSATAPMLLQDDLSDDDLQVPLLSDDTAAETNVIMFEDEESDQTTATVVKKGRKSVDESAFDLDEEDSAEVEDDLEVSDDVLGEDDELEDLDAFATDEDEFEENFESGASRIGFATPAGKIAAPPEVEWSTGFFLSLCTSSVVLMIGAVVSADLLKTTWGAGDVSVYQGELLGMIGSFLK